MEIEKRIVSIIAETIEVSEELISEDTAIGDFPTWDSMGHLLLVSRLEKEFSIKFDPEAMMDMEDVADIIEIIEEYTK